jgi:hypothetical protein
MEQKNPISRKARRAKKFSSARRKVMWRRFRQEFSWAKVTFEFLFVLAAVFFGLYFDSLRHNWSDYRKEKKIGLALYQDLLKESSTIKDKIDFRNKKKIYADSLIYLLNNHVDSNDNRKIYYYHRSTSRRGYLSSINPTIEQIKVSGDLEYFRSKKIVNEIISYEVKRKDIEQLQQVEEEILFDLRRLAPKILYAPVLEEMVPNHEVLYPTGNLSLRTKDPEVLNEIACNLHYINSANNRLSVYLQELKDQCDKLILSLRHHYKIKK